MEYFDVCDEQGEPTGEVVERGRAHREGIRHRTAHVWILRQRADKTEILLQKRSRNKDSFPGLYDTSSTGHVLDVKAGPEVTARFLSEDEENHVSVRVFGLLHRIPAARRTAALEACNELSEKLRFFKFCLDPCSNVNVETDLPTRTGDDCLGECCFELFVRLMNVLENEYPVLAKAVYEGG